MRQVVLDTETTGLEAKEGHRIIEIGCLELVSRRLTEKRLHHYVNPERDSDAGALAVHGLSNEFLADKPKFAEIAVDLIGFVRDAEVIIHNAAFDLEFLDAELARLDLGRFEDYCRVTDSLKLARELHPGKRNSLDALCERYNVSNAHRTLHGALLDAGLLADVYLAMTRGQDSLVIDLAPAHVLQADIGHIDMSRLIVIAADPHEITQHEAILDAIEKAAGAPSVWRRVSKGNPAL